MNQQNRTLIDLLPLKQKIELGRDYGRDGLAKEIVRAFWCTRRQRDAGRYPNAGNSDACHSKDRGDGNGPDG